ncbi:peptidoglycan DD-metalloendopeptidase family protein [Streptomyces sp. SAI-229]|jgi:murein DD-endopeptidase MepM/ murein hydrolase activator NlpD|uniref:peptidoglycan DD-metalloendopeptidase family protein n=1 Tax=Streptomyces sp. SAI-229 TaxID=3377731 RepID=UPI003C79ED5B
MTATINYSHVAFGRRDSCVQALQKALIAKGYKIANGATGYYGDQTKAAVASFQRKQGWTGADADGLPGPRTFAGLGLADSSQHPGGGGGGRVPSPVPGRSVSYPFGVPNPRYAAGYHTGDDYAAPRGAKVVAVRDGTIEWSNENGGAYGWWIGLRVGNGRTYVYCHLSARSVSAGNKVRAGQEIGAVGSSGNTTGPHLHFEDRPHGGGYGAVRKPAW